MTELACCTAVVHGHRIAVPLGQVQEVLRIHRITPVPRTHPTIVGVLNLRGMIVPVVDVEAALGGPAADPAAAVHIVVRPTGRGPVSLLVDAIGDIVTLAPDAIAPIPGTAAARIVAAASGVWMGPSGLTLILAIDPLTACVGERWVGS